MSEFLTIGVGLVPLMTAWAATIAAGVLPVVVILVVIKKLDYRSEPWNVLLTTFWLGMMMVAPLVLYNRVYTALHFSSVGVPWIDDLLIAFTRGAFPEEVLKFLVLYGYCIRRPEFREPMDGVVYGATASLGFAAYENICFVAIGGLDAAITRSVTAVPAHACFGALMGYYYQRALCLEKRSRGRVDLTVFGLSVAIFLHTLYDFSLLLLRDASLLSRMYGSDGWELVVWRWMATLLCVGTLAASLWWTGRIIVALRAQHRRRMRQQCEPPAPSLLEEQSSTEAS
ncbi:MAG TPA: PrsW family glutamic-type intramembrane protease [Pirellulales bacterium]